MSLIQAAIASIPFPQLPLVTKPRFASFLGQRDINVGEKGIDALVNARIIERLCDAAQCFHPFQVWPIAHLLHNVKIDLGIGIQHYGLDVAATERFVELQVTERIKDWFERFPQNERLIDFNERLMPMLLWLESYYLPKIRGVFRAEGSQSGFGVARRKWQNWVKRVNLPDLLVQHSLSIDELIRFRSMILNDALWHDPAEDAYLLFRSMPFFKRDQFKGNLRVAYDLYEIAELLRLYVEDVSDSRLPKEWNPAGEANAEWATRRYGGETQFGNPVFMRPLVREYGLDPSPRVLWLVEGRTEKGFITKYVDRTGEDMLRFVTIEVLHGDGSVKKVPAWLKGRLISARNDQCFVTVTLDDSDKIRKNIDDFKVQGLINIPYVLNGPDFENETFRDENDGLPIDHLLNAMLYGLDIPPSDIGQIKEESKGGYNKSKGGINRLIKAFNDAIKRHKDPAFQISKGEEWGKKMADYLSDKREEEVMNGTYSETSLSKIERQILSVWQCSQPFVDFPSSIKKVNPGALEIE